MKDLEELKNRLPPGIDIRITSKNVIKFWARFRRKGHKDVFTTKCIGFSCKFIFTFDRLVPSEKNFLRAMAELGPGSYRTGDIADILNSKISSLAPVRA